MGHIPPQYLDNLEKYTYKGVDKSLLSRYVLNSYWNWLITLWPASVAPNTITLTGLLIVILNFFSLLYYDPEFLTQKQGALYSPPNWLYFTWAIGLFAYQSLDAIDGKQARKTGMSGPLGEMFDHGCDALNTTLEVILGLYALNLGRSWWTVASLVATHVNFYLTTWEEYHTGQLYLGVFSGPVEGIIIIVFIFIVAGIFGPSFWDRPLSSLLPFLSSIPALTRTHIPSLPYFPSYSPPIAICDIPLNVLFMIFSGFGLGFNILTSYSNVRKSTRTRDLSFGKKLQSLLLLLPAFVLPLTYLLWLGQPLPMESSLLYSPLFLPMMCSWGLQFAHQVGRTILSHVTKMPFPIWDNVWLMGMVGGVDASLPMLFGIQPIIQRSTKRTTILVYATLSISFIVYARFCYRVIQDVTEHLGIACFTVSKKDERGMWKKAGELAPKGVNGRANGHSNGAANGHGKRGV